MTTEEEELMGCGESPGPRQLSPRRPPQPFHPVEQSRMNGSRSSGGSEEESDDRECVLFKNLKMIPIPWGNDLFN